MSDPTEPRNQRELMWEPLDRPVGPVDLPAWVKDIHVNWNDGFSNGPETGLGRDGGVKVISIVRIILTASSSSTLTMVKSGLPS